MLAHDIDLFLKLNIFQLILKSSTYCIDCKVNDVELDSYKIQFKYTTSLQLESADGEKEGLSPGGAGGNQEDEFDFLTKIIKVLNDTYSLELSEEDKVEFKKMKHSIYSNAQLMSFFNKGNSKDNIYNTSTKLDHCLS